jgi:putative flippase GtrA
MKKLIEQFLKFGVVGVIAFAIDYGVLMLLNVGFGMDSVIAAAISFTISVVFNYVASMRFVFTHREDLSKTKEFIIFVVLSVIGLIINELCMWAGQGILGVTPFDVTVTKLFATAVVMVWNFFSRKKWLDAGDAPQAEAK